jgi:serine/threonine-protein kinase
MARRVAPDPPVVAPLDLLAQYELQDEIGKGERAWVYRARDCVLDQAVAVKLLRDRHGRDPSLAARLYLTARAAASLGHPHIVAIYDHGQHDGSAFITSELIEGRDLGAILAAEGPLPAGRALPLIARVLDALSAAHTYGIAHGALHPRNIIVRAAGADGVVLTDFGMGFAWERGDRQLLYRAPEEHGGDGGSVAGDLYAVATILYELLDGERPPVDGLRRRPATIARPLFATLAQALAVEPGERFPTAAALRDALTVTGGVALPAAWVAAPDGPLEAALRVGETPVPRPLTRRGGAYRAAAVLVASTLVIGGLAGGAALLADIPAAPAPTAIVNEAPVEEPTAAPAEEAPPAVEPTASVAAAAPTVPPTVAVPTVAPTPTATLSAQAAALAPSGNTPPAYLSQAPTPTSGPRPTPTVGTPRFVANGGVGGAVGVSLENFSPYLLQGAYQPSDVRSREEAKVAIYGSGSGYNVGILTFEAAALPTGQTTLVLSGLDDETSSHSTIQILLNGRTLFSGTNTFENRPASTQADRSWSQMVVVVPAGTLQNGTNTLVIRNISTGAELAAPYILIHNVEFAGEAP